MHLSELVVHNFRNIEHLSIKPHPRLNVVVGDNGQGKTNLLESIAFVSTIKPIRPIEKTRDLIRFEQDIARVKALFQIHTPVPVEARISSKGKEAFIFEKKIKDAAILGNHIVLVSFVPDDLQLIKGSPAKRRKALDRFAFGLSPTYAALFRRYEHALHHRNKVLKAPSLNLEMNRAFSETLIQTGTELIRARRRVAERWAPQFSEMLLSITEGKCRATFEYQCQVDPQAAQADMSPNMIEQRFRERLLESTHLEMRRGTTMVGPHLDDFKIWIQGKNARHLASQGQIRALVLALKLSKIEILSQHRKAVPMLLLDDVVSELDRQTTGFLFKTLENIGAQTFVSTTDPALLPNRLEKELFNIRKGKVLDKN